MAIAEGMTSPAPTAADLPPSDGAGTERAIRFAVYLTGGLVALAFGINNIADNMGQVLNCLQQTDVCTGGFSQAIYYAVVPGLVGGSVLVAVALVLFVLAHRTR